MANTGKLIRKRTLWYYTDVKWKDQQRYGARPTIKLDGMEGYAPIKTVRSFEPETGKIVTDHAVYLQVAP